MGADPGVAEDEVVGAAGDLLDDVFGVGVARGTNWVPARAARWPPAEKPMMTMRVGVDLVVAGAGADGLDGAAGVEQGHGQEVAVRGESVAEDEGAEAANGEPVGDLSAFENAGEAGVSASGEDDDGRAGGVSSLPDRRW